MTHSSSWPLLVEDETKEANTEGGKPPEVSDEELETLDEEAARKEVEKLKGMGVIAEIARDESSEGAKWLTLKNVYDWRFRSPGKGEPERWFKAVQNCMQGVQDEILCRDLCTDFRIGGHQVDGCSSLCPTT